MGVPPELTRLEILQTHITMNAKIAFIFTFVCAASGRVFLLDDIEGAEPVLRVRRDVPSPYAPPAPAYHEPAPYHAPKAHGRVGPVYTFVKTDPQANFKWGVRHRAGAQYGR